MPKLRFLTHSGTLTVLGIALVLPFICFSASSTFGIRSDGMLDQPALSKAYKESDWEQVIQTLENYLRRHGDKKVSVEERVFAFKYLGVIYAADSLSRSKAESFFTRLLNLVPDESIVDLFPSKRVQDIFQEVRDEKEELMDYNKRRGVSAQSESVGKATEGKTFGSPADSMPVTSTRPVNRVPIPFQTRSNQSMEQSSNSTWVWWTVGIAAAAGAGAGVYYLSSREPEKKIETLPLRPE